MLRSAWTIAILIASIGAGAAQPSEAYVNQADPSSRGRLGPIGNSPAQGGAYIFQLPETARPAPPPAPPRRVVARRAAPAPQPVRTIEPQAQGPAFPNVGAGVALALSQPEGAGGFPNVGAGVGAQ